MTSTRNVLIGCSLAFAGLVLAAAGALACAAAVGAASVSANSSVFWIGGIVGMVAGIVMMIVGCTIWLAASDRGTGKGEARQRWQQWLAQHRDDLAATGVPDWVYAD